MKKNKVHYRQGDVLIIKTDKNVPEGLVRTKKCTLAFGEVTGHHHTIERGAIGYAPKDTDMVDFFQVEKETDLVHQDHGPIKFEEGNYEVIKQSEYTPGEFRRVAD